MGFVVDRVALGQVFLSVLIFSCQHYSTNAPRPFIHLTLTLYDLSNCQCREMKLPSKMYKMRLKNLRT